MGDCFDKLEKNLSEKLEYIKKAKKLKRTILPDLKIQSGNQYYAYSKYANKICSDMEIIKYAHHIVVHLYTIIDMIKIYSDPYEFIVADIELGCVIYIRDDWEEDMIKENIPDFIIKIIKDHLESVT